MLHEVGHGKAQVLTRGLRDLTQPQATDALLYAKTKPGLIKQLLEFVAAAGGNLPTGAASAIAVMEAAQAAQAQPSLPRQWRPRSWRSSATRGSAVLWGSRGAVQGGIDSEFDKAILQVRLL